MSQEGEITISEKNISDQQCAWIHESKGTKCFWGVAVVAPIGGFRFLSYQSRAGVFGSRKEKR